MIMRILFLSAIIFLSCSNDAVLKDENTNNDSSLKISEEPTPMYDSLTNTIHIFVALCDNKYQGIVPVGRVIGNGQDPHNNLYWGCGYGIRTYFKRSKEWKFLRTEKVDSIRLERIIFQNITKKNTYLIADAYDGQYIKQCTRDFLASSAGMMKDTVQINGKTIGAGGNSQCVAYIGHDGLMEFTIEEEFVNTDGKQRDIISLACYSRHFFAPYLKQANVNPMVWTSHLMAPEAYTIHDALSGYVKGESNEQIRTRGASAYARFQNCGIKGARNLIVTGW